MQYLKLIIFITVFSFIFTNVALGDLSGNEPEIPSSIFGCEEDTPFFECAAGIANFILKVLIWVAIALATIMFVWAGLLYIWGGDNNIKEAKNRLIYAAIGLVIALIAFGITLVLQSLARSGVNQ
jgi:heme A synthase